MKRHILLLIFAFLIINVQVFSEDSEKIDLADMALACSPPSATYTIVPDCDGGGEQFLITINVSSFGDADSVVISDNMGSGQVTLTAPGTHTYGPYPNGINVIVTVANADDPTCKTTSNQLTQTYCPTGYITPDVTTYTVEQLVTDVLINSECANVTNITYSTGVTHNPSQPNGIGYFDASNAVFGISSGLILSTGNAMSANGPGATVSEGSSLNWPGDQDLTDLIHQIEGNTFSQSYNATILEFDFTPFSDHISFNFLFASAEYGTFQCSYSDVFAFFLTDITDNTPTTNLAVVPGTDTPVAVTTIRDNLYNSGCPSMNAEYFDKFYGANGLPVIANPIRFNGYTKKMTAESDVIPGHTYHIKLAIADRADSSWDSAVFLEAGSFDIGTIDLGPDLTIENQNAPCEESSAILDTGLEDDELFDIVWYHDGEIFDGADGMTIEVTEGGEYMVFVIYGGSCILQDSILVEFAPVPQFEFDEQEVSLCGYDSVVLDGTPANADVFETPINFDWFFNGEQISGAHDSTLEVSEGGVYTVELVSGNGCFGSHTFIVDDLGFNVDLGSDMVFCDTESYVLNALVSGSNNQPDDSAFVWSGPGVSGESGSTLTASETGVYTVSVNIDGCVGEASVYLEFNYSPIIDLGEDLEVTSLDLEDIVLDGSASNISEGNYQWYLDGELLPDETGPTINPGDYGFGTYTVVVYGNDPDCSSTDSITITELLVSCEVYLSSDDALEYVLNFCEGDPVGLYEITFSADFDIENGTGEEVVYTWYRNEDIVAEGGNTYTASFDAEGQYDYTYTVVGSADGCSASASLTVNVTVAPFEDPCIISEGLSPGNNDGFNDNLNLSFLAGRTGIDKFEVYSRYGNIVYDKADYVDEWKGQDNSGNDLPTGTYYYAIKFKKDDIIFGKVKRGWIYVNRKVN